MNDKMDRTGKWLCAGMLGLALTTTAARGDSAAGFFRAEAPSNGTVLVSMPFHPFAEGRLDDVLRGTLAPGSILGEGADGDGLDDFQEFRIAHTNPLVVDIDGAAPVQVGDAVAGSLATATSGSWGVDGDTLFARERAGSATYTLTVPTPAPSALALTVGIAGFVRMELAKFGGEVAAAREALPSTGDESRFMRSRLDRLGKLTGRMKTVLSSPAVRLLAGLAR